ncbi:zinc finger protein 184-like isoform X3 [Planococcus citri]|uniref:zinc finger protein 184-like isoform X3 n=1 Tax=Planococcus citri TaxID=170843 RepID=UPI0031F9289E
MDLSDSFSEEKSEQGVLGTSSDQVTSNQFKSNISCKIKNYAYPSDQENNEPNEIQSNTGEQFTKHEDLCVACGHVSAYKFFSFPIEVDIRQQWAKFCDINLDKIKPYFRLCDGHFKPEDYQISMQRGVLMPTSVPTLPPKVKHNFTPSIVNSFSTALSNKNTSQNTICSSDFERNTTTANAPDKRLRRNFKDITNNQKTIPPKAAKFTSKKNLKLGKCQLLTKHFRSEIFRLKIRCSSLEDAFANFKNEIKLQVDECFVTRANTTGNVVKGNQNSTSSINASSENSRNNLCNTEARTDQRSVKDALVGSAEHVTEYSYSTDTNMASLAIWIDDAQNVEVKSEPFTEEVKLEFDEPVEWVAEDNHSVNSTISPPEISTDGLHIAVANLEQFSNELANAETWNVTESNRCPLTTFSLENSNSRRCSTEDPPAQHFEEVTLPKLEYFDEDSQSPNSPIPSSEKSHESRYNVEARAGCSKNQENSGQGGIARSAKQKKHLPSVKKPTKNSSNVSTKVKVPMRPRSYCCNICGTKFSYKRVWKRHQHQHTKPFHCQFCDKQFSNESDLTAHLTLREKKQYKCSICDRRFALNVNKLKHERLHVEGAHFQCADCGKKFFYKHSLIRHQQTHKAIKRYKCCTCGARFNLEQNKLMHERFTCKGPSL